MQRFILHLRLLKIGVFQWIDFHTSKIINMIYSIHLEIEVYERCWIVKGVYAACCCVCVYIHTNTQIRSGVSRNDWFWFVPLQFLSLIHFPCENSVLNIRLFEEISQLNETFSNFILAGNVFRLFCVTCHKSDLSIHSRLPVHFWWPKIW